MEKIAFISDSAADIPQELCEKYEIGIVPVHLIVEGQVYREYYDIKPEEYWQILINCTEVPTTSQVTPGEWMEAFEKAKANGCTHIICFTMSSDGSGGYQSGCAAREQFYENYGKDIKIVIFDSRSYAYIFGRVVVEVAELAQNGESFENLLKIIEGKISRIEGYLGVYDLKVIRKSGRISGAAALVGGALGLKPISHVFDGGVPVCDKVRGNKALIDKMLQRIIERVDNPEEQTTYLLYAEAPSEDLDRMENLLKEQAGFRDVVRVPLGATITSNTGGRALAVAYYGRSHKK